MNNSGMELNAVLHAPGVPEKNDPPVKKGDVFKNSQDGSHVVVERVSQGEDGPIIYSSQDGSRDRRILGRPLKNFLVDVGVRDMESIDPIQNREPVFYAAYENQMEILGNAFSREFFACEKALDEWEASLKGKSKTTLTAQLMIGLNRQKMDEIADEWEKTDDRLVRGGRRRMALLAEIRDFSQRQIAEDLLERKNEALVSLKGEYGTDEPDGLLIERGYFRDVLHAKVEHLLGKCRRVKSGKLKMSDEVTSLTKFEREVKRLNDSIVGYESGDVDRESAVVEIKSVLDALTEMERVAFHPPADDEVGGGKHAREKKPSHRMKKNEPEELMGGKPKGGRGEKGRKHVIDKRAVVEGGDSLVAIPPTIQENGVQLEKDPIVTPAGENVSAQPMKNPGESMPVKPKPEKGQEVLIAFKEAVEKEKQVFFEAIQNADSLEVLQGIGFAVGRSRKFFVENGDNVSPVVRAFVDRIKSSDDRGGALKVLDEANKRIKSVWNRKNSSLKQEKNLSSASEALVEDKNAQDMRPGDVYVSKKDPSKEFKIVEDEKAAASGEVAYVPMNGGGITRSTTEKLLKYLQAKEVQPVKAVSELISSQDKERGRQVAIELNQEKELWMQDIQKIKTKEDFDELTKRASRNGRYSHRSAPGFVIGRFLTNLLKKQNITSDQEKGRLKGLAFKLQSQIAPVYLAKQSELYPPKAVTSGKDESVADATVLPVVEAATITPENIVPRTYDELLLELGKSPMAASLEKKRLDGVVAAGFQEIISSFSSEEELKIFARENRAQFVQILSESIIIRLKSLPWDTETQKSFAKEFSERSLDDFIK